MIHYRKEGNFYKLGLNVTFGRNGYWPWVAFAWIWYNVEKRELFKWYLRLRSWQPAYFYSCYSQNVVDAHLISKNLSVITDECVSDLQWYITEDNGMKDFLKKHNLLLDE